MSGAQSFGRYRVTGTLGAGAMGEVYAAVDEVLGREVAVKTLKGHSNGLAARMLDERFRQEARAIASLAHPGVVQVFDIDLKADPPYLVMERVAGPSLKERFAQGTMPVDEIRALGIQIGRALAAAHAAKIVHRDVKPANILVAGDRTWKLADFGVAHIPDSSLTMTGQFVGSPAYAPPEALVRGQSDAEGDVYGLGATLYQAAAGRWPRLDDTSGALIPTVPPLSQLAPHIPEEIADVIDRAIATEPQKRPTATQLADALAHASSGPHRRATSEPAHGGTVGGHVSAPSPYESGPIGARAPSHPGAGSMVGAPARSSFESGPIGAITSTAFVSDSSIPGVGAVGLPYPPRERARWKPYAAAAGVVLLIGLVAAVRGSDGPKGAAGTSPMLTRPGSTLPVSDEPLGDLIVNPPPNMDGEQAEDWNEIADKLADGEFDKARKKIGEFERLYGESDETVALRQHLDKMRAQSPSGRKRGKGKKYD